MLNTCLPRGGAVWHVSDGRGMSCLIYSVSKKLQHAVRLGRLFLCDVHIIVLKQASGSDLEICKEYIDQPDQYLMFE